MDASACLAEWLPSLLPGVTAIVQPKHVGISMHGRLDACTGAQAEAPGPSGEAAQDEFEGIDPEFIAALPPDIQAEVLEQQRRDRLRRQAAAQRAAAQQVPSPDHVIQET